VTHPGTSNGADKGRYYRVNPAGLAEIVTEIELAGKTVRGRADYLCGACGHIIGAGEEQWSGGQHRCHLTCPKPVRNVDVDDCRNNGWYPSRSAVDKVFDKTGMTSRRNILVADYASDHPRQKDASQPNYEDVDSYGCRMVEEATAHWTAARDTGTEFHAALWTFLQYGHWPDDGDPAKLRACKLLAAWLRQTYPMVKLPNKAELRTEICGVARDIGIGLTIDFLLNTGDAIVGADLKTVGTLEGFKWGKFSGLRWVGGNYRIPGWAGQIGGYDEPLNTGRDTILNDIPQEWRALPRQWLQFVVSRDTGDLRVHQWLPEEIRYGWRRTDLGRQSWMLLAGYVPPTVLGDVAGVPTEAQMELMAKENHA